MVVDRESNKKNVKQASLFHSTAVNFKYPNRRSYLIFQGLGSPHR